MQAAPIEVGTRQEADEALPRLIDEVKQRGFKVILTRLKRYYRIVVWSSTGDVVLTGTSDQVAAVLIAIIMAYNYGAKRR